MATTNTSIGSLASTGTGQQAIERTVTGLNYELVDVQRAAGGLLRVMIDRLPAGVGADAESINVDDCERVTRQLQYVLEVEGVDYQRLEVSSPGLDRPLKKPADFSRFAGARVNITLKLPFKGRKNYCGELMAASEGWRLLLEGAPAGQTLDFQLDEVREARLVPVLDFKGRSGKNTKSPAAPRGAAAPQEGIGGH